MESILVAVDGSRYSDKIVQAAIDMAKKTSSVVILTYGTCLGLPKDIS